MPTSRDCPMTTILESAETDATARMAGAARFFKGRVALYAILKALGIGRGHFVVVPGYTCVVVPTAVQFAGATPVYADIDPATYNVALPEMERAVGQKPVKAVIVQHTYGLPANVGPILRWARERNIRVIEDCCHGLSGRYLDVGDDSPSWTELGTLGDAAFFSSQWSKPFTTGLGGWATARDPDLLGALHEFARRSCVAPRMSETAALMLQMAAYRVVFRPSLYWFAQDTLRLLSRWGLFVGSSTGDELQVQMPHDYAKRIWPAAPRLAARQWRNFGQTIEHRRRLQKAYDRALSAAGLPTLAVPDYADPVLLRYPLRVGNKPEVLAAARRAHVELGDWFDHPLHPAGANVAALGWHDELCPHAREAAETVVNLPMHNRVSKRHVERVVAFLARQWQSAP